MEKASNEYYSKFGYNIFGPLLLKFSYWLNENLKEKKITKVYFLARDGYILKKSFDLIKSKEIKSYYLYASRRSIIVPSLVKVKNFNEIFELISFPKYITLRKLLKKVGFDEITDDINNIFYDDELDKEYEISFLKDDITFQKKFKMVLPIILNNSNLEFKELNKYLMQNKFEDKVAIVDIGWYGSMQKALNNISSNVDIYGFYLGLYPKGNYYDEKKSFGFLFDKFHNVEECQNVFSYRYIFEFLTLAQHGSVKRFTSHGVEFYDYEYEGCIEKDISIIIQNSAIKYIKDNCNIVFKNIKYDYAISKFFLKPKLIDIKMFGDIRFEDGDYCFMAKPKSIFHYLFHITSLIDDFKKCGWKLGFMKRFLKIPLPYYKINMILRKRYSVNGGENNE